MFEKRETTEDLHNLLVEGLLDKRHWDLPLVEKDAELSRVLAILSGADHLWVVDSLENKKLLGIVTEIDVLKVLSPKRKITYFGMPGKEAFHWEFHEFAEHLMSKNPLTCKPSDKLGAVLDRMLTHGIRCVAVVDNSKIIGEVSLHNVIILMRYYFGAKPKVEENKR